MPESFEIKSAAGAYRVQVGTGLIGKALAGRDEFVVLADQRIAGALPARLDRLIRVPATEEGKSLECIAPIIVRLCELGAGRGTHLVAVGGGIIQDIATFVSSVYMRGIPWTYFPTTLLGMVDSCIGGKSSINVGGYKNLVGNFYPPKDVVIDLDFLTTLSVEHIISGLCEAAKICYARGFDQFESYLARASGAAMFNHRACEIIVASLQAKKWFIEIDEFDQGERLLLNFGHTFGHAIESGSGFRIGHGIAVGIGMLVAVKYAELQGLLKPAGNERVKSLVGHVNQLLGQIPVLRGEIKDIVLERVMEKFESDKKHYSDKYRVIVPEAEGNLVIHIIDRTKGHQANIRLAFERVINGLTGRE